MTRAAVFGPISIQASRRLVNGKLYFAEAVITVSQDLHPQRVQADGAK